ncbi:hypothetical protein MYX64_09075 [Nitrospinae bacterium AH_259_B05_G02_I21]|nr:hypothetical protein [Nitrospinae bacterium AH_259_B05_G02_I21]
MPAPQRPELIEEERRLRRLQAIVREVSLLILDPDFPAVDVAIARQDAREEALRLFPDKADLWEMIYESRFDRLIAQFRPEA